MNLVKCLTASVVVITYQTSLKLINGLRFLDQTSGMNVDHESIQWPVYYQLTLTMKVLHLGPRLMWDALVFYLRPAGTLISLYGVQKTRVKSFQIRSCFGLPLYGQAVSLVLALQFLVKCFRMIKKNVSIIFSFSMGVCPNDLAAIIGNENCSPIHSSHRSDIPYSNRKLLM